MSVQAWFPSDEHAVRPGDSIRLSVTVENASPTTESYTITPAGLTAAWVRVSRPTVTLFGGSRDVVEITLRPPAASSTTAGPTTVAIRIVPQSDPDASYIAETVVEIDSFDDRRISLLQPLKRGRRRATYEFLVENHGNSLANCRLHLVDPTGRVDGQFDPPAIGVAPGATTLARLNARAERGGFRRSERQLDIEIEATEPNHRSAVGRAILIQPATIPGAVTGKLVAAVAAVLLLWGAWAGLVQPAIDDAVNDAVVDQPVAAATQTDEPSDDRANTEEDTGSIEADSTGSDPTASEPAGAADTAAGALLAEGTPEYYRLNVEVGVGQSRSQSIIIPPDADFMMTDLVVQNPGGDDGAARMLRNDDELYEWQLGALTSANEFQPRVSPLPLRAGDSIVLEVSCTNAGSQASSSCDVSLLMTGVLVAPSRP